MKKYKISAVSYLNTKPFIYGIQRSALMSKIDLSLDIPSVCAKKLLSREVDIALVPIAIIPELEEYYILSDYCIGAIQSVKTVCLFSDVPIHQIEKIYLDYHSRTSVKLIQYLCKNYWKIQPEFVNTSAGFEQDINHTSAGLVIGDRAFDLEKKKKYVYDLVEAWREHTGLPFVFAVWISNRKLPGDFLDQFNSALKLGVEKINEVVKIEKEKHPNIDVEKYFKENINFVLDKDKREGMNLFLELLEK